MSNSKIQSTVFNKKCFSEQAAREWLKQNKYKISKVYSKSQYYKFKQLNPAYLKKQRLIRCLRNPCYNSHPCRGRVEDTGIYHGI